MESASQEQPKGPDIRALQQRGPAEANLPQIAPGFSSLQAYELLMRQARMLANTTLVPEQYREVIVKTDYKGNVKSSTPNPSGLPNCALALNMAQRMNADPIMVMQNLVLVEGRPSWSSQWVIAQINNCGRFEPLRFDLVELGERTVTQEYTEWENNEKQRKKRDVKIEDVECTAWTVRKGVMIPHGVQTMADAKKAGLPFIKGPKVSIGMAVKEGWYTKTGSKWQTIPELMLHYRSGAFFGRLYAPELLMGIPSQDEIEDTRQPVTLTPASDGTYGPSEAPQAPAPGPAATNVKDLKRRSTDAQDVTDRSDGAAAAGSPPATGGTTIEPTTGTVETPAGETAGAATGAAASSPAPDGKPEADEASDGLFGNVN